MNKMLIKSLFIVAFTCAFVMIFNVTSNAASLVASPSTVKVGENVTVSVSGIDSFETFECWFDIEWNGAPSEQGHIVYLNHDGIRDEELKSISFKAKGEGVANIKVREGTVASVPEAGNVSGATINVTPKTPEPPPQNTNTQPANTNTEPKPQNTNTQPKPENTNTNPPVNNTTPKNNTVANNTVEPTVVNPEFKAVNEKVYAVNSCNVRSSCSTATNNNKIGSLEKDELVIRTGVSSEWSRIVFNGKVAYVASKLLTTTPPDDEENTVEENTVENEISNELDTIKSEVGVLPEVGNNVSVQLFFVTTMISISIISSFIYLKIKEK